MDWNQIVEKLSPYIVKIETPEGHGTGFIYVYSQNRVFAGVATAAHVVSHAERWQQPIRLVHQYSMETIFLKESQRVIYTDSKTDSAVILFEVGELNLPETPIPLLPSNSILPIGAEVGWLGFPSVVPYTMCFFSGNVSARQEWRQAYLIDGVAINGVSGGPVVYSTQISGTQIVGTISSYLANRATGETLPGLSVAQDVSHFHNIILEVKSLDDAAERKQTMASRTDTPEPESN